jgi:ABC-type multidrug transport system fused ATPase/permease subunit
MSYELSKQFSKAPITSMREVESTEQLEWILEKSLSVIEKRDEYYRATKIYMDYRAKAKEQQRLHKNATGSFMIGLGIMIGGAIGLIMGLLTYAITLSWVTALIFWLIATVILTVIFINRERSRAAIKYSAFDINSEEIKHSMEKTELAISKQKNWFWCVEIIPVEYRNQKAVEIMLTAVRNSRADNWKECCDIYDKECRKQEMREYQAAQLALSQEAASNTAWAAAGAWATFGAILWK